MRRPGPLTVVLAAQLLGFGARAGVPLELRGGSLDDQSFAKAAAGLRRGETELKGDFQAALEAIRATDRFRKVEGEGGRINLDPWPPLAGLVWRGDAPSRLRGSLFPELRKGSRPGALRLEALRAVAQDRLVAAGYPQARLQVSRTDRDTRIVVEVAAGRPNLIKAVEVVGNPGSFTKRELIELAEVVPGRTLWCRQFELDCLRRLRRKIVTGHWYEFAGKRYECRVDLDWDTAGTLRITVEAGPVVKLSYEGSGLFWDRLKDLVPLTRSDRYSPELLDEGERRIVRLLRSRGYLDPQVSHRTEGVRTGPGGAPEVVKVIYTVNPGTLSRFGKLAFEGTQALSPAELKKAGEPGRGFLFAPKARPEAMDDIESRLEALYESKGYTDVKVRRQVDLKGGKADLTFRVRQGGQRLISWVRLDLPTGGFGDPWGLGGCLPLLFSDKPVLVGAQGGQRVYHSDRREMAGVEGTLESADVDGRLRMTLKLNRPIPLLKGDFFKVYTAIRQQRLVPLGVIRPTLRSQVVEADGGYGILIEVPDQAMEQVQRLVVQGSDKTRAKAVLREITVQPGDPLDQDKLSRSQGRLGALGAFSRVEVSSLAGPDRESGPPSPWKPGDLQFRTEERSPWVVTNSFGYDRTQGYYIGTGVQRLNVGGMGRTLDFDVRAGDHTIHNPTLRDVFSTGKYTTSLDSYSVAYTDPWFIPDWILPDNTSFRAEGAYTVEERYIYEVQRHRLLASLRWAISSRINVEVGYRFERVSVGTNVPGLSDTDLANIARYPPHATISAPYFQVVRDTRDNAFDPTTGMYSLVRFEAASQALRTSENASFMKLDLRNQWTWPVGYKAEAGVVALGLRLGIARPTASTSQELPLSERFFGGGPGTERGVQPDYLGPLGSVPIYDTSTNPATIIGNQSIPLGGQALFAANLEYRFPMWSQSVWGELFVDSAQVYERLQNGNYTDSTGLTTYQIAYFPPLRTALGLGLILKFGIPVKFEYAADVNRLLGRPRDTTTQLHNILVSAGFQF